MRNYKLDSQKCQITFSKLANRQDDRENGSIARIAGMDRKQLLIIRIAVAGMLSAIWVILFVSIFVVDDPREMGPREVWDALVDAMLPVLLIWLIALSPWIP